MSRPIRAFLMVRDRPGEWTATVCRDLESVEDVWNSLNENQTAVLHIGFDRPASAAFEHVAASYPGRMLVTAAAQYGLPAGYVNSFKPIGVVDGIPVHLALAGWGYALEDLDASTVNEDRGRIVTVEPRGWVARFLSSRPDFSQSFEYVGIFDEESYLSSENALSWEARYRSGIFRLRSLTEDEERNPCAFAAASPPWLINRKLESMDLTVRVGNVVRHDNIQTVADLARVEFNEMLRMPNFGRKSAGDLYTSLLNALNEGPPVGEDARQSVSTEDATAPIRPRRGASEGLLVDLDRTMARLADRERDILIRRMGLGRPAETLDAIAKDFNVTRERIRQIESKVTKRIIKMEDWDDLLSGKLEKLLAGREFPLPVLGIEAIDEWFRGISHDVGALRYILANFCGDHIGITVIDGVEYVGFMNQSDWDRALFEAGRTLRYGAEQGWTETHCKAVVKPILGEIRQEFRSLLWDKATEKCHFATDPDGTRTLVRQGGGVDGIVEAILLEADHPLHYSEISKRASARSSRIVDAGTAHNAAASTAILLGRGIYGMEKHIALSGDEKDLVRQEAESVLLAGPAGRQWHAAEVLAALLEGDVLFEQLDAYVIDHLLRGVQTLRRLGRMTWIVAQSGSESAADRIDIRQAVIRIVEEAGQPLTLSEIRQRLVAVRGVSQNLQIAPADPLIRIGAGRWGLNDRDVPIKRPDQLRLAGDLVAVLQARGIGLHISEVEDEIGSLWPDVEPQVLFGLAALDPRLHVSIGQFIYIDEWGEPRREALYDTLRRVLACADQPLTFEQVVERTALEIGREPLRRQVTACLQGVGAFDSETGLWSLTSNEPC